MRTGGRRHALLAGRAGHAMRRKLREFGIVVSMRAGRREDGDVVVRRKSAQCARLGRISVDPGT